MKFDYTYWPDENNIRRKIFDHRNGDSYNEYSYDDIDRVTGVTYHNSETEAFTMDDLGNRTSVALRDSSSDAYSVDTLTNRYNSIDAANLDYDAAGNLITDKDGYQFTYDYENRMTQVRRGSGVLVATMDYDTQGRRIRVYDAVADTTTLYYYSDNWQVLAEYDGSDTLQAYYVFGNYIDEVLLMHRDSTDYFYIQDHLYSPVALTNSAGAIVERYEYDAYGKATVYTDMGDWDSGSPTTQAYSDYGNLYLFTGRRQDRLDDGDLIMMYYRARTYNPETGRFMQQDPIGYVDGLNMYEYIQSCLVQKYIREMIWQFASSELNYLIFEK